MIHDELVVECPKEDGEAVAAIVVEEMERAQQTLLLTSSLKLTSTAAQPGFTKSTSIFSQTGNNDRNQTTLFLAGVLLGARDNLRLRQRLKVPLKEPICC